MDKEEIISLLKQINYPGYNRDIVSFGIIKKLSLTGTKLSLQLNLQADSEIIDNIQNSIHKILKKEFHNLEIIIDIVSPNKSNNIIGDIKTLSKVNNIIAIASGKGGVGKSTTTINLAAALSKKLKIGILDLDIYGPSLPMALGCLEKPVMNSNNLLTPIEKHDMKLMSFGFLNDEDAPTIITFLLFFFILYFHNNMQILLCICNR